MESDFPTRLATRFGLSLERWGTWLFGLQERLGASIMTWHPRNPVRRWFEAGWAKHEAARRAWDERSAREAAAIDASINETFLRVWRRSPPDRADIH